VTEVFIGIGSNVEPEQHVRMAVTLLRERFGKLRLSPVYRNRAVGFEGQDFLNLVAAFDTLSGVTELGAALDEIEVRCGRQRGAARFAPRSLDLDLLSYGDEIREQPPLPRPEILRYDFVLKPLADLAPSRKHPVTGRSYAEHWSEFKDRQGKFIPVELKDL
jgi:2-amino-4-hydroxy-6-hydroxymethyldihydropteridine diphosphokinase